MNTFAPTTVFREQTHLLFFSAIRGINEWNNLLREDSPPDTSK